MGVCLPAGFSEEQLVQLADSLRPAIIPAPRPYYQVRGGGGGTERNWDSRNQDHTHRTLLPPIIIVAAGAAAAER